MKIILFSEELRKCLNAAGLSDCGENDAWNYWYQRLMNAHNESVERQIITEQAENAKLRELVLHMHTCLEHYEPGDTISCKQCPYDNETWGCDYERLMAELGIEVDE